MTIGICIEVPLQQILVRGEVVVCRTRLEHIDERKAAVLDGRFKDAAHQFDVPAEAAGNEGRLEREDEVHARQRALRDAVWVRVHRLTLPRERTRLAGRQSVVRIIVKYERDWIIAPHSMDQVRDSLRESRTIPAEGDDWDLHICKLRARCKRDDTTMEPVEAVALDLVRTVAVAADIVAEAHLPRTQLQLPQRILHGGPYAIVAAAVAPGAFGFRVVFGNGTWGDLQSSVHDEKPASSGPRTFFSLDEVEANTLPPLVLSATFSSSNERSSS